MLNASKISTNNRVTKPENQAQGSGLRPFVKGRTFPTICRAHKKKNTIYRVMKKESIKLEFLLLRRSLSTISEAIQIKEA